MTQPNQTFTIPVVCTTNENDWYIFFQFFHAGEWHKRKLREGINRIKDRNQRKKEASILSEMRHQWLKEGWNPVTDPEFKLRGIQTENGLKSMHMNQALDFALENKTLASKSLIDYRNILNHIKAGCTKYGYDLLPITEVKRIHILDILKQLKRDRILSNHGYNKYLCCISSMFSKLEEWCIIDYNPASKIKQLPVAESEKYQAYTDKEKEIIEKTLRENHYNFYIFFLTLYHTGIRPKELLSLHVSDVHIEQQLILILPDLKKENSKTKFIRPVPIANELLPYLKDHIANLPKDCDREHCYLFGSLFKPGKGNGGGGTSTGGVSGAMRKAYFTPSYLHIKRDTVTKLWHSLIIKGAGINKYLYAGKHTGANDKIMAGIDLDALRELYGHQSKYMTEKYAKIIKQVNAKQIREKAPAFKAKVIPIKQAS